MQRKKLHQYHLQQQYADDGGITCLQIVLRCLGTTLPWSTVGRSLNRGPVTLQHIKQEARQAGLTVKGMRTKLEFLRSCTDPCILAVLQPDLSTGFAVFYGFDAKQQVYWIGHPTQHRALSLSEEELDRIWISRCLLHFRLSGSAEQAKKNASWWEILRKYNTVLANFQPLVVATAVLALLLVLTSFAVLGLIATGLVQALMNSVEESSWSLPLVGVVLLAGCGFALRHIYYFFCARMTADLSAAFRQSVLKKVSELRLSPLEQNEQLGYVRRTSHIIAIYISQGLLSVLAILLTTFIIFYTPTVGLVVLLTLGIQGIFIASAVFKSASRYASALRVPSKIPEGQNNPIPGAAFRKRFFHQLWIKKAIEIKTVAVITGISLLPLLVLGLEIKSGNISASTALFMLGLLAYQAFHTYQLSRLLFDLPGLQQLSTRLRECLNRELITSTTLDKSEVDAFQHTAYPKVATR